MRIGAAFAALGLVLALAAGASAAPLHPAATRAELTRWLEALAADGTDIAVPRRRYEFSANATEPLEALSLELVRGGYRIDLLQAAVAVAQLSVTRVELLTPSALQRRNEELRLLARKHGARYDGIDASFGNAQ